MPPRSAEAQNSEGDAIPQVYMSGSSWWGQETLSTVTF